MSRYIDNLSAFKWNTYAFTHHAMGIKMMYSNLIHFFTDYNQPKLEVYSSELIPPPEKMACSDNLQA